MGSSFLSIIVVALSSLSQVSGLVFLDYLYPNFTASKLRFVDQYGTFLSSHNRTFTASMYSPANNESSIYLCVIHVASTTVVWSANRDAPVSNYGKMMLTLGGIMIYDENGTLQWSTPPLRSPVSALLLKEEGNLVLLDHNNVSLWESFDYPTDTIVIGQRLPVGTWLNSSVSNDDLSIGNYSFSVSTSNAVSEWNGLTYWKLSMSLNAFKNSNYLVEYMAMNSSGLYLFANNGSAVVYEVSLPTSDFRFAKLDASGQFIVASYDCRRRKPDFVGPDDKCEIPFICGSIGLCTDTAPASPTCSCPLGFQSDSTNGCVPSNSSLSLAVACNGNDTSSFVETQRITYMGLGSGNGYFGETSLDSLRYGLNFSSCQDLCSASCSCLGIFYGNSTGYCLMIFNQIGSLMSSAGSGKLGYVKAVASISTTSNGSGSGNSKRELFLIVGLVVFPFASLLLLAVLGVLWWKRWKHSRSGQGKFVAPTSSSGELEAFSIPGLPVRYTYEELKAATDDFSNQIGSGGFGTVYKGVLSDNTVVAVKKITNLSSQGKREFCTEIGVIGNVRHANLVKLKGFCAQGRERLLVYEYMNRGSLDRTLFGTGPALEWQERLDIVIGTARGLAYLHTGCEHKIIHCDVKPENILLHDHFQAKLSDFGLSKLLNPEQSGHVTTMRGTRGYLAPEWLTSSAISDKTDVYSFGMVLLEIVSGRKNCSFQTRSNSINDGNGAPSNSSSSSSASVPVYFPMFALEMHEQGKYLELADPRLEGRVTSEDVEKLVRIALCCVHEEPPLRPSMVTVVGMLEERISLGQPRLESLQFLHFYGRRFAEPSMMEEGNGQSDLLLYQQANWPYPRTNGDSHRDASYLSSQQISGPR
ncbi:hypothetical protein Droror1_Dr00004969 [Drosera rotundifolia]